MPETLRIGSLVLSVDRLIAHTTASLSVLGCFFVIALCVDHFLDSHFARRGIGTGGGFLKLGTTPENRRAWIGWVRKACEESRVPGIRALYNRINSSRRHRDREAVIRELPHMIDVITLSVGAGLPFDQALASYTEACDGVLARHFKLAQQYWQTGLKLRAEALDDVVVELESRELARFVSALKQSLVLGTALVYVLEAQGTEARDAHRQHIETQIAKTPVKMLIPMATCVIPSLLLLLLGPVVIDVMRGLGSPL